MATKSASTRPKSEPVEPGTRYAKEITKDAKVLRKGDKGEPNVYKIPLRKEKKPIEGKFCTYTFGEKPETSNEHKVIMMVGATGAGKSTLINIMINYILGVEWEDGFRFKMVDEQGKGQRSQAQSQTQIISSYTIRRAKHHCISYTLTIIDTPGFGDPRGVAPDKAIVGQIQEFFSNAQQHKVDHIDGICFVAQASEVRLTPAQKYIFHSILALFGEDVKPNILLLLTFCDKSPPKIMDAIKQAQIPCNDILFKFNNAALYVRNTKSTADDNPDEEDSINFNKTLWRLGMKSLKNFFENLDRLSPKCLTPSKGVLEDSKRLENTAKEMEQQHQINPSEVEKLQNEQSLLEQHQQEMEVKSTATTRPKSEPVKPGTRYAKEITKDAAVLRNGDKGEPDIYKIPLKKENNSMRGEFCTYVFGEKSGTSKQHKVIMMVGAIGAGKSTLINVMVNYILGVEWEDGFRFKMADEQKKGQRSQTHRQTKIISSYTIRENKHHNIPYTLTIIDTPGFRAQRGIEGDDAIVGQIQEFFSNAQHHKVDHIDGICFVAQASEVRLTSAQRHFFNSILSLFCEDLKANILVFPTFCDQSKPTIMDAIEQAKISCNDIKFKFNNAALYVRNTKSAADDNPDEEDEISYDKTLWRMGMKSLQIFFDSLAQLSPKSFAQTTDVPKEPERFENTAEDLLEHHEQEIKANESSEYEDDVVKVKKTQTNEGALNCRVCGYTCHYPCRCKEAEIKECRLMEEGYCIICPKKCVWSNHKIQNFKIEFIYTKRKQDDQR